MPRITQRVLPSARPLRRAAGLLALAIGLILMGPPTSVRAQGQAEPFFLSLPADRLSELEALGWKVGARGGGWAVVLPPPGATLADALPSLTSQAQEGGEQKAREWIARIAVPYPPPAMDEGMGASEAWAALDSVGAEWEAPWPQDTPDSVASPVVLGVVDTGTWLEHPAFADANGRSRIAYYWDQEAEPGTGAGSVPADLGYGLECRPRADGLSSCDGLGRDQHGHGTHTLSIAGGSGEDVQYQGVAPEATLVAVRMGKSTTIAHLANGIYYVLERARALGLPAVVNVSYGTHLSAHDGSHPLDAVVNALSGPGRVVVVSAGNSASSPNFTDRTEGLNDVYNHAEPPISDHHATATLVLRPRDVGDDEPDSETPDGVLLDIWLPSVPEGTEAPLPGVRLTGPGGRELYAAPGETFVVDSTGPDRRMLLIEHGVPDGGSEHTARVLAFAVGQEEGGYRLASGSWSLDVELASDASWQGEHLEAWLVSQIFAGGYRASFPTNLNRHLVSAPASADEAIAVGAWTISQALVSLGDEPYLCGRCSPVGGITFFSSVGPRTDGRIKPDIIAPGDIVAGARPPQASSYPEDESGRRRTAPNPLYGYSRGTSQAAPVVAGVVAHLLADAPNLTPADVRNLLAGSAIQDAWTHTSWATGDPAQGRFPNATWGYGKINFASLLGLDESLVTGPLAFIPESNPVRGTHALGFRMQGGKAGDRPRAVSIYSSVGSRLGEVRFADETERSFDVRLEDRRGRLLPNGFYILHFRTQEGRDQIVRLVIARVPSGPRLDGEEGTQ